MIRAALKTAENLFTPFRKQLAEYAIGRAAAARAETELAYQATHYATRMEQMSDLKIFSKGGLFRSGGKTLLKESDLNTIIPSIEKGEHYAPDHMLTTIRGIRKLLADEWKEVQKAGGIVSENTWKITKDGGIYKEIKTREIGREPGYFPHFLKQDWAEKFAKDGDTAFRYAAGKVDDWAIFGKQNRKLQVGHIDALDRFVDSHMNDNVFSKETREALSFLIKRDKISVGRAMIQLRDRGVSQLTSPFAVLRKARKINLMPEAYEQNPVVALDTYFRGSAKHIAAMKAWGPRGEYKMEVLAKMAKEAPELAPRFELLTEIINGSAEYKYNSREIRNIMRGFTEYAVGTKIGLGTAFIPNIFQIFISTVPKVGVINAAKAAVKLADSEALKFGRGTGIQGRKVLALEQMAGMSEDMLGSGMATKIFTEKHPGMMMFQGINRFNNMYSAIAGREWAKSLYRRAGRGNKSAISHLEQWGLNPKVRPDDKEMAKFGWKFATEMQLQRNALADPLWMNDPRFRFLALFKRFGLRQGYMVYDQIIGDLIKHKDPMPLLRLMTMGFAGGAMTAWSKDAIRRGLFKGPDYWDEGDKNMFQQGLYFYAQSGAFGMLGDIALRLPREMTADQIVRGVWDNAIFSITPIAFSEFGGVPGNPNMKGWPELFRDISVSMASEDKEIKKSLYDVAGKISPLGMMARSAYKGKLRVAKEDEKLLKAYYGGR